MRQSLKSIYDDIPGFECVPGCVMCCGHVPWSVEEWEALPHYYKNKVHLLQLRCGLSCEGRGCEAYAYRPFTCRMFGVVRSLPCPQGQHPEYYLQEEEAAKLTQRYIEAVHFKEGSNE